MPRTARTKIVSNRIVSLNNMMRKNIEERLDKMAFDGANMARRDLSNRNWSHYTNPYTKKGIFNSSNRTGATANSIYKIPVRGESEYADVANAFRVRAGKDYSGARSLEEIVFPEHVPSHEDGIMKSGFASLSLIVAFWEYGHNNQFTGRYESAPLISLTAFVMYRRMPSYFKNISTALPKD